MGVCVCVPACVCIFLLYEPVCVSMCVCVYHCVCLLMSIPFIQSDLEGQVAMEAYEESVILFTESSYDCALVNLKIKVRSLLKPGGFYHDDTIAIMTAY